MSLTAFSQKDTKNTTDSNVVLPKPVAKEVVKDLIRKDSLESELKVVNKNVTLLENNLVAKDSVIALKDSVIKALNGKEQNYLSIITLKDQQKKNLETLTKDLAADLRKAKRKQTWTTIGGVLAVGGLTYLLLK